MRRRLLAWLAVSSLAVLAGPAAGQPPAAWIPPLAPDGHPDLQGVWLSNSATPLERPKALEGRQFLTDAEVVELKKRADRIFKTEASDYAGGDNAFLAALNDVKEFKSATATSSS